jgi:hypothetical protein
MSEHRVTQSRGAERLASAVSEHRVTQSRGAERLAGATSGASND